MEGEEARRLRREGDWLVRVIRKLGLRGWNGMWKSESDGM